MKILAYPKDGNPYQRLLYSNMPTNVVVEYPGYLTSSKSLNILLFPIELLVYRIRGYRVFHIHWLYPFHLSKTSEFLQATSERLLWMFLRYLDTLGYKTVWTVHNWLPHERTFLDDEKVSTKLAKRVDHLIAMNSVDLQKLVSLGISKEKLTLVPIGNFIGFYKENSSIREKKDKITLLFFGTIKPYKGIENLVNIFSKLDNSKAQLRIVGSSNDTNYLENIQKLVKGKENIKLNLTFVQDNDISYVFEQSDLVVLPFEKLSNSSSAVLAFSQGKPIIAPRIGSISDYPDDTGYYYPSSYANSLREAIKFAISDKENFHKKSEAAYKYAKSLDWKMLSSRTSQVYKTFYDQK